MPLKNFSFCFAPSCGIMIGKKERIAMEPIFTKEFDLRTSDFDCRCKLQPASILDLFQAVAGEHANQLGCGFLDFLKEEKLWVVVRTKYQLLQDPALFQRVRVKTWPLPPARLSFQREYLIEATDGTPLVKGTSDWVVIHATARKLVSAKEVYPMTEGFCTDTMFEERTTKLHDFETEQPGYLLTPGFSQLDMNGHVNNTKYANYVLDAINLTEQEQIDSLQIDFRHEVQSGQPLTVLHKRGENEILAKGLNAENEIMFSCRITLK